MANYSVLVRKKLKSQKISHNIDNNINKLLTIVSKLDLKQNLDYLF